jgi:hypothetical protein
MFGGETNVSSLIDQASKSCSRWIDHAAATTGNTMAPCVIIGERAGEILKADHKL